MPTIEKRRGIFVEEGGKDYTEKEGKEMLTQDKEDKSLRGGCDYPSNQEDDSKVEKQE